MDSSPKNENSVMYYSPSCRTKPVRSSFIFKTQMKIFEMKSESFLTLCRQQQNYHVQGQKRSNDIVKIAQENKIDNFLQQFLRFRVSLRHVLNRILIRNFSFQVFSKDVWIREIVLSL